MKISAIDVAHYREVHLDGVRGLAALIVVFGHCSNVQMHVIPGLDLTATAKIGVWLFFVLSGFLLTRSLTSDLRCENVNRRAVILAYAARRLLRILPLYVCVLFGEYLLGSMDGTTLLRHLTLIEGRGHYWTIPVEMTFYLLLPMISVSFILIGARARTLAAGSLLLVAIAWYVALEPPRLAGNSLRFDLYAGYFAAGVLVATFPLRATKRTAPIIVALFLLVIAPVFAPRSLAWLSGTGWEPMLDAEIAYAAVWAALLFCVEVSPLLRAAFSVPILVFVGKVSFGIYLLHWFIVSEVSQLTWFPVLLKGPFALALSVICGYVSYQLLERRAIQLGPRPQQGALASSAGTAQPKPALRASAARERRSPS